MTLRELKYVIYGEDRMGSTLNKISGASNKADSALNGVNRQVDKLDGAQRKAVGSGGALSNMMGGAASQATRMIAPMLGVAGVLGGVALAFSKSIDAAKEFRLEWRKLENLNMSKTDSQLETMRNDVLGIAMLNNFDPSKTSKAYFDVQSLTGNSGIVTEAIINKQGTFAKVFQADFNNYIAATAKAMKNYGFGYEGIDAYNKANLGVFNTGYINMDELAKVSSVYSGSASAANQSVASANKLMSLFTVMTKSPDEASTLTKSAFTDLFKKDIAKTFKDIGINLYDVRGRAKQVDQIMMELNAKFADKTSAKAMDELRNKFSGSEGINALLAAAKDQSGQMLETFKNFDNAGAGLEDTIRRAGEDINTINDDINNKLKTSLTALGETILPAFVKIKQIIADSIDLYAQVLPGYKSKYENALINQQFDKELNSGVTMITEQGPEAAKKYFQAALDNANDQLYKPDGSKKLFADESELHKLNKQIETYTALMNMADEAMLKAGASGTGGTGGDGGGDGGSGGAAIKNMLSGISGGGSRNVTVNITKMIENFTVETTTLTESGIQIKQAVEEALVRAIAGAEQTIGN